MNLIPMKLLQLLQIKPEEEAKVFLCWLMLAIRPIGKVMGWSAVQVILIKRLGLESLPYSFVLFAVVSILGSLVYLFFADAIRRDTLLKVYCSITGILLVFSALFAHFYGISKDSMDLGFFLFGVFVITASSLGDQTIGMQLWTIINDTFRPSQGMRLYPIIATAPLLGDIVGGLALGFFIKRLPAENLLFFWGFSVLALVPMVALFHRLYLSKEIYHAPKNKKTLLGFWQNLKEGYRFSFRFPFVYAIASICILFWTVASLKELQYGQIINAHLLTEAQLGKYYSDYNVYLNITVLIFQLSFTGRIVKFLGVGYGFYALPITILSGLGVLWVHASFFSAICMRFSWDLVGLTIQGSSYQLAFHAVTASYRGRVRGLVEGLMNPIGGILGGCLLILAPSASLPYLAVLFSILWLFVAVVARKNYYKAIFKNLKSKDKNTYLDAVEILEQTEKQMLQEIKKEIGETSEQDYRHYKKRYKKTIPSSMGKLKIYNLEQSACYRLDLFSNGADWQIHKQDNRLIVRKNKKTIRIFTLLEPGVAYWADESGYIAFFWKKKGIIWVESGNYSSSRILAVHSRSASTMQQGIVKMQGEYMKPFARFLLEIEPKGFALMNIAKDITKQ